jgi:hypothetical protein
MTASFELSSSWLSSAASRSAGALARPGVLATCNFVVARNAGTGEGARAPDSGFPEQ